MARVGTPELNHWPPGDRQALGHAPIITRQPEILCEWAPVAHTTPYRDGTEIVRQVARGFYYTKGVLVCRAMYGQGRRQLLNNIWIWTRPNLNLEYGRGCVLATGAGGGGRRGGGTGRHQQGALFQ